MGCSRCERRRRALEKKQKAAQAKGNKVGAAAIGAVLTVTATAGQLLGISGEGEHERAGRKDQEGGPGAGGSDDR